MRNQPKYNFFKNTSYALKGMVDLLKHERSFQIEALLAIIVIPTIFLLDILLIHKLFLFFSAFGILIAEAINSAIERAVDLVTLEHHEMAGRAKDVGSAVVFLSISLFVITASVIAYEYLGV